MAAQKREGDDCLVSSEAKRPTVDHKSYMALLIHRGDIKGARTWLSSSWHGCTAMRTAFEKRLDLMEKVRDSHTGIEGMFKPGFMQKGLWDLPLDHELSKGDLTDGCYELNESTCALRKSINTQLQETPIQEDDDTFNRKVSAGIDELNVHYVTFYALKALCNNPEYADSEEDSE